MTKPSTLASKGASEGYLSVSSTPWMLPTRGVADILSVLRDGSNRYYSPQTRNVLIGSATGNWKHGLNTSPGGWVVPQGSTTGFANSNMRNILTSLFGCCRPLLFHSLTV